MSFYLVAGQGGDAGPVSGVAHLPTTRPRRYPSDTTHVEWQVMAGYLPAGGPGASPATGKAASSKIEGLAFQAVFHHPSTELTQYRRVDDEYSDALAQAITGRLGGKVGVAPRIYLRKLRRCVDRVEEFDDFDPRQHYALTLEPVS